MLHCQLLAGQAAGPSSGQAATPASAEDAPQASYN
jgi:hypothetical protein